MGLGTAGHWYLTLLDYFWVEEGLENWISYLGPIFEAEFDRKGAGGWTDLERGFLY